MQEGPPAPELPTPQRRPRRPLPAPAPPWAWLDWLLLIAITGAGAALRLVRLSFPHSIIFDETYYARDACLYLGKGAQVCGTGSATEQSYVHPPLGKLIIAIGERIWGFNAFGWRIMAAIFGTGLIVVAFLIGRKLFGRWAGALTGLFVATDFLLIVQSRVAMLDIFLAFFVALGFLFVVCERSRVLRARTNGRGSFSVAWLLAIGLTFGAASSVKWSGGYALGGAGLLVLFWRVGTAWRISRDNRDQPGPRPTPSPWAELVATPFLILIPAIAVYLAGYWVASFTHALSLQGGHLTWASFRHLHHDMFEYHYHLRQTHVYASRPWTWLIIERPVAYYFTGGAKATHVMAFANPAVWWAALGAGLWSLYRAIRRRFASERVVVTGWVFQYLPWLVFARPQFFFYMAPIVPFMMLALAGALRDFAKGSTWRRAVVGGYLVLAVGVALWWWYPVVAGVPIPYSWWHERMLLSSWI